VTSAITTLIVEGISSHSMLLDSYVVLHAAFIASLHKLIGVEFGKFTVHILRSLTEEVLWSCLFCSECGQFV
jgi:nucleolar MIF4G domain-containing protein 1